MDLDQQLRVALMDRAASIGPDPSAWSDNARRVRRDRRRRAVSLPVSALAVTGLVVLGVGALVPGSEPRVSVPPVASPPAARHYTLSRPTAYTDVHEPVRFGSVEAEGRTYDVVVFLARPVLRLRFPTDLMACVAVADDAGVVGGLWADPCQGPARVQNGDDFVVQLAPLVESGLAALPCAFGPMGNVDVVLVSPRTAAVVTKASDGSEHQLSLVPGTEQWPVRAFAGRTPIGVFVGGHRLTDAAGVVLRDDRLGKPPAPGCPSHQGG